MIQRCRCPDKQRIKFQQTHGIILCNHFDVDIHLLGHLGEFMQSAFVAGRKFLFRIDQYRQAISRSFCRLRRTPYFLIKVIQRIGKEVLFLIIQPVQRQELNTFNLILGMSVQSDSQQRAGIVLENEAGHSFQPFLTAFPEIDIQIPDITFDPVLLNPLITQRLQTSVHADSCPRLQFVDDVNIGNHPLSSRLGKQRTVIPFGVIAVIIAKINN